MQDIGWSYSITSQQIFVNAMLVPFNKQNIINKIYLGKDKRERKKCTKQEKCPKEGNARMTRPSREKQKIFSCETLKLVS